MNIQGRKWFAIFLITTGAMMIFALLAGRDTGALFWPVAFIFIGVWFIVRPKSAHGGTQKLRLATDIDMDGEWQVQDEDILAFAHDIDYDLSDAVIPPGETNIQLTAFATELSLRVPEEVGLAINTHAFVTESKMFGDKQEYIMTGLHYTSPNYAEAARKIRFVINSFAVEIKASA